MIYWCNLPYLVISTDCEPHAAVRLPLPSDDKQTKNDKRKKPFINKHRVMVDVEYLGIKHCFVIPKNYVWDGASIPFGFRWIIGAKGSDEFLIPSMVHDYMCENHEAIGFDRQLSSMVFRELLLASGVGKIRAYTMYFAVDNFQKFCGWGKE